MLSEILNKLQSSSSLKYNLFDKTAALFSQLEEISRETALNILESYPNENSFIVKVERINNFEFIFQIGGDTLVFILQSNIVRLPNETYICKSKYLKEDLSLRYFGQILIYNFLSDTLTLGRMDDPGYLLCRILMNREEKFFLEGERKVVFQFPELKNNHLHPDKMRKLLELLILSALNNDLLAPAFQNISIISYHQKMEHTSSMGNPHKIGFDFFAKNRNE